MVSVNSFQMQLRALEATSDVDSDDDDPNGEDSDDEEEEQKENEEKDRIVHDLEGTRKQESELRNAISAKKNAIAAMDEISASASARAKKNRSGN